MRAPFRRARIPTRGVLAGPLQEHFSAWNRELNPYSATTPSQIAGHYKSRLVSACNVESKGAATLVQPDAVKQILESWIVAYRIKKGMHLEPLQKIGLLSIRSLEPDKCLITLAERQVSIHEGRSRNIASLLPTL